MDLRGEKWSRRQDVKPKDCTIFRKFLQLWGRCKILSQDTEHKPQKKKNDKFYFIRIKYFCF